MYDDGVLTRDGVGEGLPVWCDSSEMLHTLLRMSKGRTVKRDHKETHRSGNKVRRIGHGVLTQSCIDHRRRGVG